MAMFSHGGRIQFNLSRHLDSPLSVPIGTNLPLRLHGRAGNLLFPFLSTSIYTYRDWIWRRVPGLGGHLALDPNGLIPLAPVPIPSQGGPATINLMLPNDPALRSVRLWSQALQFDLAFQDPPLPHFTNRIRIKFH